ncbi:MAG: hypothetical protein ACKOHM_09940 [Spartobacteria bacterium]
MSALWSQELVPLRRLQPGIGDQLKTGMGGMGAIVGSIGCRSECESFVEEALQRKERSIEFTGNRGDSLLDRLHRGLPRRRDLSRFEQEGLQ